MGKSKVSMSRYLLTVQRTSLFPVRDSSCVDNRLDIDLDVVAKGKLSYVGIVPPLNCRSKLRDSMSSYEILPYITHSD